MCNVHPGCSESGSGSRSRERPRSRAGRIRGLRSESGVAIVEFALVLPFLLLVLLAIIDFGRAINYWIDTTHLASEGARLAAVDRVPPGSPSLQDYIRNKADLVPALGPLLAVVRSSRREICHRRRTGQYPPGEALPGDHPNALPGGAGHDSC